MFINGYKLLMFINDHIIMNIIIIIIIQFFLNNYFLKNKLIMSIILSIIKHTVPLLLKVD